MKLADEVKFRKELQAGGPGSGRHPGFGLGRNPTPEAAERASAKARFASSIAQNSKDQHAPTYEQALNNREAALAHSAAAKAHGAIARLSTGYSADYHNRLGQEHGRMARIHEKKAAVLGETE